MTVREMRGARVSPFHAGEIGRRAAARARAGLPVLPMNFGQPTAGAPAAAIAVAHQRLDHDALGYTESIPLMERIARHYREDYGVEVAPSRIVLTAGASAAFVGAFASLFRRDDPVALVVPGYPAYRNTLNAMGLVPQEFRCGAEQGFRPTAAQIAALDPVPAGLVLASPANPTGAMLGREELQAVVDVCRERGIQLISDEIYHGISYGSRAVSALECDPEAVVVNSFSKLYRMPGWRLGWVVVPEAWAPAVGASLMNMFLTPSTLAQHAALAAMDVPEDLAHWVRIYAGNRRRLLQGLAGLGIDGIVPPEGAFYLYADVGHLTQDSMALCIRLVEETGLALAPGIDFDTELGHRFIRISFAVSAEEVESALAILQEWLPRQPR